MYNLRTAWLVLALGLSACAGQPRGRDFRNWAPTPPMGWNSWDCYGPTVEEHEVKANADYMAEHLKSFGWEYVVVDIRWYVENDKAGGYNQTDPRYVIDGYGRYLPAVNRFPSAEGGRGFTELARYVHEKGLKFGIHIMRGIPKVAVENRLPVLGAGGVTADRIYSTDLQCSWLKDNYTIVAGKPGAQEYYNSLFDMYAGWGVDFVKVDDLSRPYHREEIEMIRKAIDRCGRPIVFSTSPGETPPGEADHIRRHANMWRLVDDVWDTWPHVEHLLEVCGKWYPWIAPGSWPDCDMIPLGRISIRGERGEERMTRLSRDEQVALMSLWTIFRSPLMFGGDLPGNDAFTLSLLTNGEVLDIVKHSANNRLLLDEGSRIVWTADDTQSSDVFAAFFFVADRQPVDTSLAVYNSPLVTRKPGEQSIPIVAGIRGSSRLYLVVTDGGDGNHWDHADWIDPVLTGEKGTLPLTGMPWTKATAGWGEVRKDRSVSGGHLSIAGVAYEKGIGTHSASVIGFDIPEGYDTFRATAGLDDASLRETEGATLRFHLFTQNPMGEGSADSARIVLSPEQLGLKGPCRIRDLWAQQELGVFSDSISLVVRNHGARLVRIGRGGAR